MGVEWAYGGHTVPRVSGIFGLPNEPGEDPPRPPMPGLRFVDKIDMGPVNLSVAAASASTSPDEDRQALLAADQDAELQALAPGVDLATLSRRDLTVLRVLNVIDKLKASSDWVRRRKCGP
jgi:hypothetical protein